MRASLKIVGASGQGIDSIGEILGKGLKRAGYCIFGYREYPSLIKGGHASYQIDISDEKIESSETHVNVIMSLNHHGLEHNLGDVKPGGYFLHATSHWKFPPEHAALIEKQSLTVLELPVERTLAKMKAKPILGNVLLASFLWSMLGQDKDTLKEMVGERFKKKKDLLEINMICIDEGFSLREEQSGLMIQLPKPNNDWKQQLLLTGSKAMGLGAVAAGVRVYAGYPMTPSSPLLSYVAAIQNQTGMAIKQAEDEITAAQFVSGAMLVGTRALTGTSGGGFDLMSETLSLNAIIENPTVFVLAQRPGPATGLPTWTGQGDLLMAINTGHGEFARCVMSVSNATDAFTLMNEAFSIAETYQISVIVLTDKQIAEALYTTEAFSVKGMKLERGKLIVDAKELSMLRSSDRYDPTTPDGISPRWLPGAKAETFSSQGDEHSPDGTVDESALNAKAQFDKRLRKAAALKGSLKGPELYRFIDDAWKISEDYSSLDEVLIGWGSTKSVALDALREIQRTSPDRKIGYLHYTYLWPLKTEIIEVLHAKNVRLTLIEGNALGQLGILIRQECGVRIDRRILKYDGRPFFVDELLQLLTSAA